VVELFPLADFTSGSFPVVEFIPPLAAMFLEPGASTSDTCSKEGVGAGRGCPSPGTWAEDILEALLEVTVDMQVSLD
jgi:hypothetical protein